MEYSSLTGIRMALERTGSPHLVEVMDIASVSATEHEIRMAFPPDAGHARDVMEMPPNVQLLKDACRTVIGRELGIRISGGRSYSPSPPPLVQEEIYKTNRRRFRLVQ